MRHIIFYTKENCSLCDDALATLELLRHDYPFEIEKRDIHTKDEWLEKYQLQIPVVQINDTTLNCEQISYDALEQALRKASH
ncbi:glutaredoxin family protein [Lentibacillus sp. CBA3610]|uniref:glutaredoxin family protein n=1 Tax=Lentibacillus sp. CBA3610 TaxID=2518176 RepID=UPI00159541DA|nr:glutaredoxin family protein [Lentibacillus sp. CBA3610]QKY69880.1 glutaredoxin family protein [Lentibacillus sp. CBA3610]